MNAFLLAVPIAALGGLIGLGERNFDFPSSCGCFQYQAKRAVPINLAISLVTVVSAAMARITTTQVEPILVLLPVLVLFAAASITCIDYMTFILKGSSRFSSS